MNSPITSSSDQPLKKRSLETINEGQIQAKRPTVKTTAELKQQLSSTTPTTTATIPTTSPLNDTASLNKTLALEEEKEKQEKLKDHKEKEKKREEERIKMQVLVSNLSEDQLNRYEMFRRSCFPKASIKRLMQNLTGTAISQNVCVAMAGIAKYYVGEIVESALDIRDNRSENGPLTPTHIREAARKVHAKSPLRLKGYKGS